VRFAVLANGGTPDAEAAREAGYRPAYVLTSLSRIVARARAAGLLADPETIRAAVRDTEDAATRGLATLTEAVPDAAAHVAAVSRGATTPDATRLAYCREVFDRVYGKPKQVADVTTAGQPIQGGWVVREVTIALPATEDDGQAPVA